MDAVSALAALTAQPAIGSNKSGVTDNKGQDVLFAAFVMNSVAAKPVPEKAAAPLAPKSDKTDDSQPATQQTDQPAPKAADKTDDKPDDKPKAAAKQDDDTAPKPIVQDAPKKITAAPVKVEAKKDDAAAVVVADEPVVVAADAPVVHEDKKITVAAKTEVAPIAKATTETAVNDDVIIAAPVVQAVVAKDDPHEGTAAVKNNFESLADNVAKNAAPAAPITDAATDDAAAANATAAQQATAIATANDNAADAAFDDALNATLLAIAASEAKNNKADARADRRDDAAAAATAKGDALQNLVVGAGQNSPLLSNPSPLLAAGSNQPAIPNGAQAGAPSAANPSSSEIIARPLGIVTQQTDHAKTSELRFAKLPSSTAEQVQEQVAMKLRYAAKAGEKSVTIQLRPDELGRVDIKLDFKEGNSVNAKVTADNQYTLDILKRDSAGMERVLNDAGLQLDDKGLQFSLRDNGNGQTRQRSFQQSLGHDAAWRDEDDTFVAVQSPPPQTLAAANGRVDVMI